jgi:hypothetical protein
MFAHGMIDDSQLFASQVYFAQDLRLSGPAFRSSPGLRVRYFSFRVTGSNPVSFSTQLPCRHIRKLVKWFVKTKACA